MTVLEMILLTKDKFTSEPPSATIRVLGPPKEQILGSNIGQLLDLILLSAFIDQRNHKNGALFNLTGELLNRRNMADQNLRMCMHLSNIFTPSLTRHS